MGLMDKVKAQATSVEAKAQEAGKVGQAKIEAVQAKRKADALLEELGKITFEAQVGRGAAGDEKRAAELVEQLRQYEAEYGQIGTDATGPATATGSSFVPSSGDVDTVSNGVPSPVAEPADAAPSPAASAPEPAPAPPSSGGIPEASTFGDGEL
jgi:hypothetical protein